VLADRIALLDRGRLIAEGTSAELKRRVPGGHVQLQFADADGLKAAAQAHPEATPDADALTLKVPSDGSVRSLLCPPRPAGRRARGRRRGTRPSARGARALSVVDSGCPSHGEGAHP